MTEKFIPDPTPVGRPAEQEDGSSDILLLLGVIFRRAWVVVGFLVISVAAGAFWTWRQQPIYQASASVIVDIRPPQIMSSIREVVDMGTGNYWANQEYHETQYKVIASRRVASLVAQKENLAHDEGFLGIAHIEDPVEKAKAQERIDPVNILLGSLQVIPQKGSRIVLLSYKDINPERAKRLVNAWADAYISNNLVQKTLTTIDATEDLGRHFEDLRTRLEESEDALYDFRVKNKILSASFEDKQNLTSQKMQDFSKALNSLETEKIRLKARVDQLKTLQELSPDGGMRSLEPLVVNHVVDRLRKAYAELAMQRSELMTRYLDRHPQIQAVDAQIAQVLQDIDKEIKSSIRIIEAEFEALEEAERGYRRALNVIKKDAQTLGHHEIAYKRLAREEEVNRRLFETVLARMKEAGLSSEIMANNLSVLDYALTPRRPVEPRKKVNLAFSFIIGLLGGVGLAFLIDFLDNRIKIPEEMEAYGVPFLGLVPAIKDVTGPSARNNETSVDLVVLNQSRSSAAECFRTVRTNLTFMSPDRQLRRIMVGSAGTQEGKTFTATNLALSMAIGGKRVILVDTDMRRPRLHKALGLNNHKGMSNLVVGDRKIEEVTQKTQHENLDFLACGPIPPNPAELVHTKRFAAVLDDLSEKYDLLVLDSPPVLVVTDALILGNLVDGVVFVARAHKTTKMMAGKALSALSGVGCKVLGVVLNRFDTGDRSQGYYRYLYHHYAEYYTSEPDEQPKGQREGKKGRPKKKQEAA